MPPRSNVYTLPEATREELDRRIVAAGFGAYAAHAEWLAEAGYAISESALKRYGKRCRHEMERDTVRAREASAAVVARVREAAEMERAINEAAGDDPLAVPERTVGLLLARLYEFAAKEEIDAKTLQTITRSLNDSLKTMAAIRGERAGRTGAPGETSGQAGAKAGPSALQPAAIAAIQAMIEDDNPIPMEVLRIVRRDVYGIHEELPE